MFTASSISGIFHRTCILLWHGNPKNQARVVGTQVPNWATFPHRAYDVTALYRDFVRLLYRLPVSEQRDALYKLRNNFRTKRHVRGVERIDRMLSRGRMQYEDLLATVTERESSFAHSSLNCNGPALRGNFQHSERQQQDTSAIVHRTRRVSASTMRRQKIIQQHSQCRPANNTAVDNMFDTCNLPVDSLWSRIQFVTHDGTTPGLARTPGSRTPYGAVSVGKGANKQVMGLNHHRPTGL